MEAAITRSANDSLSRKGKIRRWNSDQGTLKGMVQTPFASKKTLSVEARMQKGDMNIEEMPLTYHNDVSSSSNATWKRWKNGKGRTRSPMRDSFRKMNGLHPNSINRKLDKAKGSLDAVMDKLLLSPPIKIGQTNLHADFHQVLSSEYDEVDTVLDEEEKDDEEIILSTLPSTLAKRTSCPTLMTEKSLRSPRMKPTSLSYPTCTARMKCIKSISEENFPADDETTTDSEEEYPEDDLTSSPSASTLDVVEDDNQEEDLETKERNKGIITLQEFFADTDDISEDEKEFQSIIGPSLKSIATTAATAPKVSFKKAKSLAPNVASCEKMIQVRCNDSMQSKESVAGDKDDNESSRNRNNLEKLEELIVEEGTKDHRSSSPTFVPSRKLPRPSIKSIDINDQEEVDNFTPPTTPTPNQVISPMHTLKSKLRRTRSGDAPRSDRKSLATFKPPTRKPSKETLWKLPRPGLPINNIQTAELLSSEESSDDDTEEIIVLTSPTTPTRTLKATSPMQSFTRTLRRTVSADNELRSLTPFRPPIRRKSKERLWRKKAMFKNNKLVEHKLFPDTESFSDDEQEYQNKVRQPQKDNEEQQNEEEEKTDDKSAWKKDDVARLEKLIRDNDISLDTLEELIQENMKDAKDGLASSSTFVPPRKLARPSITSIDINPKELLNIAENNREVDEVNEATMEDDIIRNDRGIGFPLVSVADTDSEDEELEKEGSMDLTWLEFRVDDRQGGSHVKRETID